MKALFKMNHCLGIMVLIALFDLTACTNENENGRHNRVLYSPRMEFAQWRPIGRGDPLKNDPTFVYMPPVLDRVRYWASSDEHEEEQSTPSEEDHRHKEHQKYHFPHQELRDDQETFQEEDISMERRDGSDDFGTPEGRIRGPLRRKDTLGTAPGFVRFVDAPHFRPRPQPLPATKLIPPPEIKMQGTKSSTNSLWVDDLSIWLSPPPLGGTTVAFSKYTPESNNNVEVVPSKELFVDTSTPMTSSENYVTDSIAEESMYNTQSTATSPQSSWTLKALLQKETEVASKPQEVTTETVEQPSSTAQYSTSENIENTFAFTTSPFTTSSYSTTWYNKPQPSTTTTPVIVQQPQTKLELPRKEYVSSTAAPTALTTDPIFSHYNQPEKPLRGPMYLIIQGHSKVKTYGPIQNDNSLVAENIRHLHPKQNDQETTRTKHLHDKEADEEQEDDFKNMFGNMDFGLGFLFGESRKDQKSGSKYRSLVEEEPLPDDVEREEPMVEHLHFGNEDKEELNTPETNAKKKQSTLVSLQGLVDSKTLALSDDIVGESNNTTNKIFDVKTKIEDESTTAI